MLQTTLLNPNWVVGFIDAEACFHVAIQKNSSMRLGVQVQLQFVIGQHIQDKVLLERFISFFGAGQVLQTSSYMAQYRIRGMDDLENILFPFLTSYPLLSKKSIDFANFKLVHSLMRNGSHLTPEGLLEIRRIQTLMNRQRSK